MNLFAERNSHIDSENAFKVGPHIVRVEQQNGKVIKLNLGEHDFSAFRGNLCQSKSPIKTVVLNLLKTGVCRVPGHS